LPLEEDLIKEAVVRFNKTIVEGGIRTLHLLDGAVTRDKIALGAVDALRLADGAVTRSKIALGAVDAARLASDSGGLVKVTGGMWSCDGTYLLSNIDIYKSNPWIYIVDSANQAVQIFLQGGSTGSIKAFTDRFEFGAESAIPFDLISRSVNAPAYRFKWYDWLYDVFYDWVVLQHHPTASLSLVKILRGGLQVNRDIKPEVNAQSNLGTSSLRFLDFFLYRYAYLGNVSSPPAAGSGYRGVLVMQQGGVGVADKLLVCVKKSDDSYGWFDLISDTFV
jgi:hypothetical protein